jgi:hypothetical protein
LLPQNICDSPIVPGFEYARVRCQFVCFHQHIAVPECFWSRGEPPTDGRELH